MDKMKKFALGLMTVLIFSSASYAGGKLVAMVVYTKGSVKVMRAGEKDYKRIHVNDMLFAGDTIKTGRWSRASLVMKGGAEVRINSKSSFEISPEGKLKEVIKLKLGQIWTRMLHKFAKLRVKTPTAVCAIRGTEADIEQRKLLTVKVYEGHVDVENDHGRQSLRAGQMSTVSNAQAAPTGAQKMGKSDMGKWQKKINVKDIKKYLDNLNDSSKDKTLKIKIKKDGVEKEIEIKMKKK